MITTYHRKIKCARHYLLKPGGTPFVMERNPMLKNISMGNIKHFGASPYIRSRDKNGYWIQNFKDYWQPEISPEMAKAKWYDPLHHICRQCKKCIIK